MLWVGLRFFPHVFIRKLPVVIPIHKEQIEVPIGNTLKHFYTYKPHQRLDYLVPGTSERRINYTNADGLVDIYDYQIPKPTGTYRIIALGDSITQGLFVETQQSYPKILENLLAHNAFPGIDRVEVLNFGVGGYDIQYAVNRLNLQGMKYKPDLVLWLVKFDDFYLRNDIDIGARPTLTDEMGDIGIYMEGRELMRFYERMHEIGERYIRIFGLESSLQYQLNEFRKIRRIYKGPLLIVYFDTEDSMLIQMLESQQSNDGQMNLLKISGSIPRFSDSHPDVGGHQQIAESVYSYVSAWLMNSR